MIALLVWLLGVYHRRISPGLPGACRFYPSCSVYAADSLKLHGLAKGSWLALRRVLSCHPFHAGGLDPVPPRSRTEAVRT